MVWPTRRRWRGAYRRVSAEHAQLARTIARFDPVTMLVRAEDAEDAAALCGFAVTLLPMALDDLWLRDTGPAIIVREGELGGVAWRFNAWGGKHSAYTDDASLARRILAKLDVPCFAAPLVAKGGAFSVDGEGTLLTTESCLLNRNRNRALSRREVESGLCDWLGVWKSIWLPGSDADPITDGHVDGIAVFAAPGVVLADVASDPRHPEWAVLRENLRALQLARDAAGRPLEIITLERPPHDDAWPEDFCASYVNSYIVNGAVLIPQFGCAKFDEVSRATISRVFPERTIVQVPLREMPAGGGGIHCATQQQPAARLESKRQQSNSPVRANRVRL